MGPTTITHDDSAIGQMCDDVFGEGWGSFRIAHLSTGTASVSRCSSSAIPRPENNRSNTGEPSVFHFCVQDPDLEGRVKLIEAHGGKQRMRQVRYYYPGQKPYRMVYCEDPFGNIFEIYSHSYELTYSSAPTSEACSSHGAIQGRDHRF